MSSPIVATRRGLLSMSRLLTVALLALQVTIAASPLFEQPSAPRGYSHAHDQQRRHRAAHDESTCAVCSARQQVAEAAPPAETVRVDASDRQRTGAVPQRAPALAPVGVNLSRAPPVTA